MDMLTFIKTPFNCEVFELTAISNTVKSGSSETSSKKSPITALEDFNFEYTRIVVSERVNGGRVKPGK